MGLSWKETQEQLVDSGPPVCSKCGVEAKFDDKFCESCGQPLVVEDDPELRKQVKQATGVMWFLTASFAIFGIIMFFVQQGTAAEALENLRDFDDADVVNVELGGQYLTAGEWRSQINWEKWSPLVINLILAAAMLVLTLWSRVKPLPAIMTAFGMYITLLVGNALVDPATIAQGIIWKVLVIALFVKSIRSALALRKYRV